LSVKNVLTVPSSAVETLGTRSFVGILSHGKEVMRPVVVGAVGGVLTQIKSGLTPGEKVIVANLSSSLPGQKSNNQFPSGGVHFSGTGGPGGVIVQKIGPGGP
jgi:macrolide-specific efflux system membrane fusion protein